MLSAWQSCAVSEGTSETSSSFWIWQRLDVYTSSQLRLNIREIKSKEMLKKYQYQVCLMNQFKQEYRCNSPLPPPPHEVSVHCDPRAPPPPKLFRWWVDEFKLLVQLGGWQWVKLEYNVGWNNALMIGDKVPPPPQSVLNKQLEPPPPPPAVTASVPRETCTADRPPPPNWYKYAN